MIVNLSVMTQLGFTNKQVLLRHFVSYYKDKESSQQCISIISTVANESL